MKRMDQTSTHVAMSILLKQLLKTKMMTEEKVRSIRYLGLIFSASCYKIFYQRQMLPVRRVMMLVISF